MEVQPVKHLEPANIKFQRTRKRLRNDKLGFFYSDRMLLHKNYQSYHEERPERLMSVYFTLFKADLIKQMDYTEPKPADD
jgi:hypothetical protein